MLLTGAEQTLTENEHANAVLQPCFTSGEIKSDFNWQNERKNKIINCKRKVSARAYPVTVVKSKSTPIYVNRENCPLPIINIP